MPNDSSKWESEDWSLEYPPVIFVTNNIKIGFEDDFGISQSEFFFKEEEKYIILKIDTTKIKNIWYADLNMTYDDKISSRKPSKYIMTFESIQPHAIEIFKL